MKLLAIDATTKSASCVAVEDNQLLAHMTINTGKTHSETLLPLVDQVLTVAGFKVFDLDLILVANGPGSFTGLRIALSTAKALAHPFRTPIQAISTLRSLSYHGSNFDGLVVPILDARRQQVYAEVYSQEGQVLEPANTYKLDDLLARLGQQRCLFVGDGVPVHFKRISEKLGHQACFLDETTHVSNAMGLVDAYRKGYGQACDYLNLSADYLRKSQAERELEAKQNEG